MQSAMDGKCLEKRIRAIFRDDAVDLRFLGLVFDLQLVLNAIVLLC